MGDLLHRFKKGGRGALPMRRNGEAGGERAVGRVNSAIGGANLGEKFINLTGIDSGIDLVVDIFNESSVGHLDPTAHQFESFQQFVRREILCSTIPLRHEHIHIWIFGFISSSSRFLSKKKIGSLKLNLLMQQLFFFENRPKFYSPTTAPLFKFAGSSQNGRLSNTLIMLGIKCVNSNVS